jgi:hypothetical protein
LLPAGPRSRIGTAFANAGGITIRPAFLTPQLFARAGLSKEPVARHPQKLRMLLIYQIFFSGHHVASTNRERALGTSAALPRLIHDAFEPVAQFERQTVQ